MIEQKRGLTLLEVTIAMGLIGLVLVASSQFVKASFGYMRDTDSSVQVHNTALAVITRMEREIRESTSASHLAFAAPSAPGIVFASPRRNDGLIEYDTSLVPFWQQWVCYYLSPAVNDNNLVRRTESMTPTTIEPTIPPSLTPAYFQSLGGGSVVARGISELEITSGTSVTISLTCVDISNRGTSTESEFTLEVSTDVSFRN